MKTSSIFCILCLALLFTINVNAQIGTKVAPGVTNVKGELGISATTTSDFNPSAMLHVKSTGSEIARFESPASSKWIGFYQGTTRKGILWSVTDDMVLRSDVTGGNLRFQTEGNNNRMTIRGNGNIGINNNSPEDVLNISGDITTSGRFVNISPDADSPFLTAGNDALQITVPSTTADGFNLLELDRGNSIVFQVNANGATRIGGVSVPAGYLFAVDGKAVVEELLVEVSPWPDYVFDSDYKLKTLEEVEASIDANGHLPGIPSAKEVEEKGGIHVGDMQTRTIEKIEELTLYAIDADKKIKTLNKENTELKNTLEELIKRIEQLEKK